MKGISNKAPSAGQKIALVTGGNRGIGYEMCKQLAERGFHVLLAGRTAAAGREAARMIAHSGLDVSFVEMDIDDPKSIFAAADLVREQYGRVDVVVNNAAIYLDEGERLAETELPVLERTMRTNFLGAYYVVRAFLPFMQEQNYGRIVNISSGYGEYSAMDSEGTGAYKLSKLALNGMTRLLAAEIKGDIKINAVCPGWVRTEMGGPSAPRSAEQAAASILWLTQLDSDGPSGGFFRDRKRIDW
ncbi:SDR family oxidoreductase [Paenibacillus sp. GCM10027628]|uniref:SDR family oxidoreductase n=1 Tax=Paenibacillus sp. GCM10027628 TaxID=3273413 RepID=UPI00362D7096